MVPSSSIRSPSTRVGYAIAPNDNLNDFKSQEAQRPHRRPCQPLADSRAPEHNPAHSTNLLCTDSMAHVSRPRNPDAKLCHDMLLFHEALGHVSSVALHGTRQRRRPRKLQ